MEFKEPLHVGAPNIGSQELFQDHVETMFDRRWLTNYGPFVQEFEQRLAEFLGVRHCVAICNATIALEIVNRHLLNEPSGQSTLPRSDTSRFESALRITRPFFRERLNVTALAIGFGERLQNGGLVRFSGDYEITDAWRAEGGIIIYIGGPDDGIGAFDSNDRLYGQIKYSF